MLTGVGMEQACATGARMRERWPPGRRWPFRASPAGLDPGLRAGSAGRGHRAPSHGRDATAPPSGRRAGGERSPASGPPRPDRTDRLLSVSPSPPKRRQSLAAEGAIAWDMESAWLARQLPDHPIAVVRTIVDPGSTGAPDLPLAGTRVAARRPHVARALGPGQRSP